MRFFNIPSGENKTGVKIKGTLTLTMIALIEGFCNTHIDDELGCAMGRTKERFGRVSKPDPAPATPAAPLAIGSCSGETSGACPGHEEPLSALREAVIARLGAKGDGVAELDGQTVHVPFTLPGERVRLTATGARAEIESIVDASPHRVSPVCSHFGICGGCAMQHADEAVYTLWKEDLARSALSRAGIDTAAEPVRHYPVASRRRVTLRVRRTAAGIALGYLAARTHDLVDVRQCPILVPELEATAASLKDAMKAALPLNSEARIQLTLTADGVDCSIDGPDATPRARSEALSQFLAAKLARVFWNGDLIAASCRPAVAFANVRVEYPPGAFLQAVEACERDMAAFAVEALAGVAGAKNPVCDLFSGLGAFTFPLARIAPVTAYETDEAAVKAMVAAAKDGKGLKPVAAVRRDLYRNPLSPIELNRFAAAVCDPPREGAEAQSKALAASKLTAVVLISCNPVTFARDAAILAGGGFQIARIALFDQFKYSAHVEIAASFVRKPGPSKR